MRMKMNSEKLVQISVMGKVEHPMLPKNPYTISPNGEVSILPGVGGITYNLRIGDMACGWEADHVEPGVSLANREKVGDHQYSNALNILSCIGNEARVASGDAKDSKGTVTGKHGGIEHVLIDFEPEILDKILIDDKVMIKTYGLGLKILDFPEVRVMNIDPRLLEKFAKVEGDKLVIPITHLIPAEIMGSGIGSRHAYSGDYDIQLFDEETVRAYHLEDLRLGDIIAIANADNRYGRIYLKGAITIGVVIHTNCMTAGHGPGVTTILTAKDREIETVMDERANLKYLL